jgi:hypothetical protein
LKNGYKLKLFQYMLIIFIYIFLHNKFLKILIFMYLQPNLHVINENS